MFPDYEYMGENTWEPPSRDVSNHNKTDTNDNDILVVGLDPRIIRDVTEFPGKVLFISSESTSWGDDPVRKYWKNKHEAGWESVYERVYQIGAFLRADPTDDSNTEPRELTELYNAHSLLEYEVARGFIELILTDDYARKRLEEDVGKDNNHDHPESPRLRAIAYVAGNCVPYRQQAAQLLAEKLETTANAWIPEGIGPLNKKTIQAQLMAKTDPRIALPPHSFVHHGGPCSVSASMSIPFQIEDAGREQYLFNYKHYYARYKYCLVMENEKSDGYLTEKLLLGLLGGCLPIYYGTKEVYDVFRSDAFIYYDIHNPQPAIDEIRRLEANDEEYKFRTDRKRPLLKLRENSTFETLDRYFSWYPNIGTGRMCRKLHEMMGLPLPAALSPPPRTRWQWWLPFLSS